MIKSLLKDITTTRDGQSYDIARVVITVNAIVLMPIMLIGVSLFVYGWWMNKPFPINDFFDATLKYSEGVGTLLFTGSAAIFFKRQTEPNGDTVDEVDMTRGTQPEVNQTTIIK